MKKHLLGASIASVLVLLTACNKQDDTQVNTASIKKQVELTKVNSAITSPLEQEARSKLLILENMMDEAQLKNIDVTREETIVWFAKEFLKFANWDEANPDVISAAFGYERHFAKDKEKLAADLPDFERKKVIDILEKGIEVLGQELRGEIKRRPVNKVDWQNTKAVDNMFVSNGKPIFLYDYFSKTVGQPLGQKDVYNDHLGALYHGGENLYPVDHDRAINSFLLKEDGTFDEALLSELTDIPDTNIGYLVAWLMGIPEWVEKLEPEIRKGRSLFQGFDLDNPLAREVWSKILRKSAEVTKGKKVIELGFVLANEPHWFSEEGHWTYNYAEMNGISTYTLAEFQKWLDHKYSGDIAQLNTNWETSFTSFTDVKFDVPIAKSLQGKPVWFDWNRYNMHRSTSWFKFMQDELHSVNPDADTHVKIWPRAFYEDTRSHGIDVEALTELTTMIGHDAKALGSPSIRPQFSSEWHEKYAYYWKGMSILHDFMESIGPNKININSESHFLSSGMWKVMDPRISYVRNVYWLATLQGMDANMGWFWMRDPDGSPEDRLEGELNFFDPGLAGAFAGSNNMQPHVSNEVTQVMFDLNSFSEEVVALREQRRPLRLFYSETSAINTTDYMTKGNKFYEEFFFEGYPLGYATQNIIEKQDNSEWDVIVVNHNKYVTDNEFAAVQTYLTNGGTVILNSKEELSLNEYGQPRKTSLVAGKGKLIVGSGDLAKTKQAALDSVAQTSLAPVQVKADNGVAFKTVSWRAVKQADDSYLVNIFNLGHNTAKIDLSLINGQSMKVVDMMTSNTMESTFDLPSEGLLLLKVTSK